MARKRVHSEVRSGSGNVFRDLKLPGAEEALAKAEMARHIADVITVRRLTQVEAARLLGLDQPKISALLRGRLSGFSTERLMRFLTVLDRDVEISIRTKPKSRDRGQIRVVETGPRKVRAR